MNMPLLCFPFAGAGAGFFAPWRRYRLTHLTVVPVQLPGRERLIDDEPYADVASAVDGLLDEVLRTVLPHRRAALFGHSLGAVLAYEMARRLCERDELTVAHLFVSGSPGPWTPRHRRATGLPEDEFLRQVREFSEFDHPALADPVLREMLLPTLRADVRMHEDYLATGDGKLDVPITAIRGVDDQLVTAGQARQWEAATSAGFRLAEIAGSHMYLVDVPAALLGFIDQTVGQPCLT
jgi:surfactin synthase thioesterase subunit